MDLGLAERLPGGRYRLRRRACSFGGTLEWYVARRLRDRLALDAVAGVNFHAPGVGGDLDVVAAGEGKLVVLELKSSPPKHLGEEEVGAFFDRVDALRPHVAIFAVDTALRLADRVIPLLTAALGRHRPAGSAPPRCVERELWALTPHVYAVNAKPDLMTNIGRALAEGLRALAPDPFGAGVESTKKAAERHRQGAERHRKGAERHRKGAERHRFSEPNDIGASRTRSRASRTRTRGSRTRSRASRTRSRGSRTRSRASRTRSRASRTRSRASASNAIASQPNAIPRQPNGIGRQPNGIGGQPNDIGRQPNGIGR